MPRKEKQLDAIEAWMVNRLRTMKPRQRFYKLIKKELKARGMWKNGTRKKKMKFTFSH